VSNFKFVQFVLYVAIVGLFTACALSSPFFYWAKESDNMEFAGFGCLVWFLGYIGGSIWTTLTLAFSEWDVEASDDSDEGRKEDDEHGY